MAYHCVCSALSPANWAQPWQCTLLSTFLSKRARGIKYLIFFSNKSIIKIGLSKWWITCPFKLGIATCWQTSSLNVVTRSYENGFQFSVVNTKANAKLLSTLKWYKSKYREEDVATENQLEVAEHQASCFYYLLLLLLLLQRLSHY